MGVTHFFMLWEIAGNEPRRLYANEAQIGEQLPAGIARFSTLSCRVLNSDIVLPFFLRFVKGISQFFYEFFVNLSDKVPNVLKCEVQRVCGIGKINGNL